MGTSLIATEEESKEDLFQPQRHQFQRGQHKKTQRNKFMKQIQTLEEAKESVKETNEL